MQDYNNPLWIYILVALFLFYLFLYFNRGYAPTYVHNMRKKPICIQYVTQYWNNMQYRK